MTTWLKQQVGWRTDFSYYDEVQAEADTFHQHKLKK
jgi:hypothetical protein